LTRAAPNQPAVRAALDELLTTALPRIVDLAVTTDCAELADLASLGLELAPQPGLAAPLVGQMPVQSVRLAALAATLTSQQVTQNRADARGGEPGAANRLAVSLNNLSLRLAALGRQEEALAAIQEAADLHRELAAARLPRYALRRRLMQLTVRPDLARSLNNLSLRLAALGRQEEALAVSQEAVTIRRELAARWPDAYRYELAGSLKDLSPPLAALGRREEALAASQEAAEIYRELAAARPDAFRPDLARSLNNLSLRLGELGRQGEALAAIQEAVTIHRELAARWPDAYRYELEQSLRVVAWLEHGQELSDASPREPKD